MKVNVNAHFASPQQIILRLGLDQSGDAQRYWTHEVRRRMTKYMPYRTGTTATKLTQERSATEIETAAPYGRKLYYGVKADGQPMVFTKSHNPEAGPFWDRRLVAAEGDQMVADFQAYIDKRRGSH